ncbi:MAG: PSD1 and planctomycete cytochrome C domain-containing protein [Acidobacteriota bacterium]
MFRGSFWHLLAVALLAYADDAPQILKENCAPCHGATSLTSAGLNLTSRDLALKGGSRGPALTPGKSHESLLYRFAAHLDEPHMPPNKPLTPAQLSILKSWIDSGADWAAPATLPASDAAAALARLEDRPIKPQERAWWAFQPPVRKPGLSSIDAFLQARWQEKSLSPAPRANRRTLIRRAYLDMLGIPPTPQQVEAFLADNSPNAWQTVVDRLLASPHYGERWARHWMDVARYADSGGYEYDRDRDNAWRYRDYLTRGFNADKPYDRFLQEQIAGDELFPGDNDASIATGFLRLGPENNIKNEQTRLDELDDVVSTTANSLLALTVGCARCHNHKFDPIPQKDYYRLQAVFWPIKPEERPLVSPDQVDAHKAELKRIQDLQAPLKKELEALIKPYKDAYIAEKKAALPPYMKLALATPPEQRNEGQKLNVIQIEKTLMGTPESLPQRFSPADKARHVELNQQIAALEKQKPKPLPTAMAITEAGPQPEPSYFLHRGSQKGSVMQPGVLSVVQQSEWPFPAPPADAKTSHRRAGFARWITSRDNPLTARVMVNRIWQHHFGEGLVRTPNNFGRMGERPSHPELLDWLSLELMDNGWRLKPLHRLILTSAAYQMASDDIPANLTIDPDNRLLWRMPRRRVEGEIIRDSILAVAGSLDRSVGGEPVFPYIDPSLFQASSKRTWIGRPDDDPSTWRRSLYVFSKRSIPLPMFEVFDKPDTIGSCARRSRSTVAPQALILMNNSFVALHARRFADRLDQLSAGDPNRFISLAFEHAFSRPPSQSERERSLAFLSAGKNTKIDFSQALFNSNEFVYIP